MSQTSSTVAFETNQLQGALQAFSERVNENHRAIKLMRDWSPDILVEAADTSGRAVLRVREQRIESVDGSGNPASHVIEIRAEQRVLLEVFAGRLNPSIAFVDGDLEVFGSDDDRLKLDAITLVVWGA